ncbi:AcrR family transcriptional regulator [Sphingomonas sp. BE138]|uniref:TetR/AcrR family transcriptional regulator n=1 Tax=Sphingomonas sp. BE138 TaxID=2817845 RepID=UPI002860E0E7|nr:TetR family transcriptional regulator [Sphingomonas sp. BE138]MDR6788310.1 AcrR family transcriptional regulator [Sphingomonas sp. BE138]
MRDGADAPEPGARPMRRDALARRNALIEAARVCFARAGYFVPLEEIADVAGVGRGTFYRNFKDRVALALAVFEREIDRLGALVDPALPLDRALARLVIEGEEATRLFARLTIDMPLDGDHRDAFDALRERLEALLRPLATRGHREGTLARDLGARELTLAVRMLGAIVSKAPTTRRDALLDEALALVTVGLRPR